MTITYDPDADMLYIGLLEGSGVDAGEIAPGVVVDYDSDGRIIGIEFENASKLADLKQISLSSLPAHSLQKPTSR